MDFNIVTYSLNAKISAAKVYLTELTDYLDSLP